MKDKNFKLKSERRPSITVFYPFLNDWGTIGSLVILAADTLEKLTDDWEIIVVNDGSGKRSQQVLEAVAKQVKGVRIVHHPRNRGYGAALRTGFAEAKKNLIFYTDGDAQYDIREMTKLVARMDMDDPKLGMVNGYKIKRHDPLHRVIAGRVYHHLVKFFFRLPIRDTDCDFRLIRSQALNKIRLRESTGTICVELVKTLDMAGYKIAEVPVHHYWRWSGKSQFFNFGRLARVGRDLIRLWWRLMVRRQYR